jgi:hypothetical protein
VIAFERVKAAEPAMLEAVKEALVYLDAPPGSGFGRPRALRDYWSSHHTVLASTNKCLAQIRSGREDYRLRRHDQGRWDYRSQLCW